LLIDRTFFFIAKSRLVTPVTNRLFFVFFAVIRMDLYLDP